MSARRSRRSLRRGRPASDRRELFLAPGLRMRRSNPSTVASTVRRGCRRAGIPEVGWHRAGHTTACEMVSAGVPIARIGQVLRHRVADHRDLRARGTSTSCGNSPRAGQSRTVEVRGDERTSLHEHVDDYLRLRRRSGSSSSVPGRSCRSSSPISRLPARARSRGSWRSRGPSRRRARVPSTGLPGWQSHAASPPICRRSIRPPRFRRPACSRSATSARPRTCGQTPISAGCSKRRAGSRRR